MFSLPTRVILLEFGNASSSVRQRKTLHVLRILMARIGVLEIEITHLIIGVYLLIVAIVGL